MKAKKAAKILRNEGPLAFGIKSLQAIQALSNKKSRKSKNPIYTRVRYSDAIRADLSKRPPLWTGTNKRQLTFNWLMPPPGKGSGGHHNIFRFIKFLEDAGHQCRIYLYAQEGSAAIADVKLSMGNSYPSLQSDMQWIGPDNIMEPADGIFATSWETAYSAFNSPIAARRFYFVQDFEPYFYPAGSLYALAENTYKFGFYGITAGGWLSTKLKRDYAMETDHFDFGSDQSLYSYVNDQARKEVLFYVRPFTERRGFEVGVMALGLFHQKHPKYIINLVGWDVSNYKFPFPYNNLKTLELSQLNELYNRCATGLLLSFTNMSLLPLELLGSGTIPVMNDAENNRLVSDNQYIGYASDDPVSLANKLSEVISRKDLPEYAKKAAASIKGKTWEQSGRKFVTIVEREVRNHE